MPASEPTAAAATAASHVNDVSARPIPPGLFLFASGFNQGDHLSEEAGKPGNVREFDSCQGNVRDFTKSQGNVREKILSGKSCLKLFIVNWTFASIQVFSTSLFCVKYLMCGFGS